MKHALKTILMRIESTYAQNLGVLTAGDFIIAQDVEVDPLRMEVDDYAPVSGSFGDGEKIIGPTWCTVQFDVLVGGGGAPLGAVGGAPNHDVVLRASSMSRSITPGVAITYAPVSTGEESANMTYHLDNTLFQVVGLRGDLEWTFQAGRAPRMRFTGIGLRIPMADQAPVNHPVPPRPRPVAMTAASTAFTLDGSYAVRCSAMTLRLGNAVEYINRANVAQVLVSDQKSSGSITLELPNVAQYDFMGAGGICSLGTVVSLSALFGSTPGNRVLWGMPAVQLINPRLSGDKGTTMLTCDLHLVRNGLTITYT